MVCEDTTQVYFLILKYGTWFEEGWHGPSGFDLTLDS